MLDADKATTFRVIVKSGVRSARAGEPSGGVPLLLIVLLGFDRLAILKDGASHQFIDPGMAPYPSPAFFRLHRS